jgi:uncharacterized coiled-coil protein SlyX
MPNEPWHMSKSVPISFIFAIVMQTVALVWFVSSLNSSVEANAKELVRHETRLSSLESVVQTQAVTLGRLDENIKAIRTAVEKMANESP